jgi:hypothetical protein
MAYKEKICPKCNATHNKRGEYCSRSCGNQKPHTPETLAKLSITQSNHMNSGHDSAQQSIYSFTQALHPVPEPVAPPTKSPLKSNQFVSDGDLWTEA